MSFFGGGTDMESFFRENGGAVLSTTFDKSTADGKADEPEAVTTPDGTLSEVL